MIFQLKRIDSEEPLRILERGKHNIGPGKFLLKNDTNIDVPVNHAQLVVTEDVVSLKALNKVPCWYTKTKTIKKEILRQSEAYTFSNGDRFGLTFNKYWYELTIFCGPDPDPLMSNSTKSNNGDQLESEDIISVSDAEDDPVVLPESTGDSNEPASVILLEEPVASSSETAGNTLDIATTSKREQESKESSPVPIKKAKTESPPEDVQDEQVSQSEPMNENVCVCCPPHR